jgi:hypothetical protein
MRSVGARILAALAIAVVVAIVLFYIGVALVYVAIVGGALAIVLLILFAIGRGVTGGSSQGSGRL